MQGCFSINKNLPDKVGTQCSFNRDHTQKCFLYTGTYCMFFLNDCQFCSSTCFIFIAENATDVCHCLQNFLFRTTRWEFKVNEGSNPRIENVLAFTSYSFHHGIRFIEFCVMERPHYFKYHHVRIKLLYLQ